MRDRRSRSLDPSFGLRRLTLEDQEPGQRHQSPLYLQHSGQGDDIPTQSHSGSREVPQPSIGEEEQVRREQPDHLEVRSWYPRGEGILQGPFVEDTDSPYLPQRAPYATQSTPQLYQGVSSGPSHARSLVGAGLARVNSRTLLLPPLPPSIPTLIPGTHVEGTESSGPISFRDIGVPEAEGRLRRAHNLASGVSLTLNGLPEPAGRKRPPQSYNLLVQLAIWESPERRLTLQEIYASISNRFEYYRETSEEMKRRWQVRSGYF